MGTRFCGALGSLCAVLASGGSSRAVRSASAVAWAGGRSAEHSRRTTPAHGAPAAPGSWRYQELRRHEVPMATFRSWRAGLIAVLPLMLTSILCEALMAKLGMGVKVATLPVTALGVGIGVDYALYMLSVTLSHLRAT